MYGLYKDQTLKYTELSGTRNGTYSISANEITIQVEDKETEKVPYRYHAFTDTSERTYKRLYNYKLNFVTGTEETIETQTFGQENGYAPEKPEDPSLTGASFIGWYNKEGEAYDFDKWVTKSETLYAKWEGSDGRQFLAAEIDGGQTDFTPYIAVAASVLILLAACAGSIVLIVRGKKYAGE